MSTQPTKYAALTPEELAARKQKFGRKAAQITTQEHLDRIMHSFPEDERADILKGVKLGFARIVPIEATTSEVQSA